MSELLHNERVILTTRQHWSVVAPGIIGAFVILVAGVIVLGFVPADLAGQHIGTYVNWARLLIVLGAVGTAVVRYLQWQAAEYQLTSQRIVVRHGVLSRVTESINLDRIQDVIVRQSLGARMLGAGSVDIESAGRDGIEVLHRIPNPGAFYNAVMEAMEERRTVVPQAGSATPAVSNGGM